MYSRQANIVHHIHGFGHIPRSPYTPQAWFFSIQHPPSLTCLDPAAVTQATPHCPAETPSSGFAESSSALPACPRQPVLLQPVSLHHCSQCHHPAWQVTEHHSPDPPAHPFTSQSRGTQTLGRSILRNSLMEATKGCESDFITKRRVPIWVQVQFPEWHYPCSVNSLLFKRLLTVHICTNAFMLHSFQVNSNGFLLLIIHEPFCPIIMKF